MQNKNITDITVLDKLNTQYNICQDQNTEDPHKTFFAIGGAAERWDAEEEEILYEGPKDTGKTRADLERINAWALEYPGSTHFITRDTRASMTHTILRTFERDVLDFRDLSNPKPNRASRAAYNYKNTSQVIPVGLDKIDRHQGAEVDTILACEATIGITEDDWEKLTGLCTGRGAVMPFTQLVAECNPGSPNHFLLQRALDGKMRHIKATFSDNPSITEKRKRILSQMTGYRYQRLYKGLWVSAEGQIIPNLDKCVVPHYDPPPGRLIGGIDFGWVHPFAALVLDYYIKEETNQPCAYLFFERRKSKTTIDIHGRAIPNNTIYWCDHEPESIKKLRQMGHKATNADKRFTPGVECMNRWIESGRLEISDNVEALLLEAEGYVFEEGTEKAVKENDDCCDALRYDLMGLDTLLGRTTWKLDDIDDRDMVA